MPETMTAGRKRCCISPSSSPSHIKTDTLSVLLGVELLLGLVTIFSYLISNYYGLSHNGAVMSGQFCNLSALK
jgi:hypothetical protein